jgi:DNA-binding beta-propeller fold protein YncE
MIPADGPQARLQRFVAAYKLLLAQKAEELRSLPETWGQNHIISLKAEQRLVAGDGQYRLSPYPYPGLRSFDPQEGEIFFGRERNVADVQKRLATERTVVVLGGSGSGKSSLLRAGLLPFLNTTRRIPGREGGWYRAEFRPRTNPLAELVDALVDQWLLPIFDLNLPAVNKAMGLLTDMPKSQARATLHNYLRARFFHGAEPRSREEILRAIVDVTSHQLDEYDRLASQGLRVPGPSLILLLDQFEEVFRPEVPPRARDALLNLIVDLHRSQAEQGKGGLFLAVTMRSEELHLCAEHRGLSDVINRSSYLLELLDPEDSADRTDLHRAIVQPARNAFEDWGLAYDPNCPDAPFEPGMPDWLLEGAKRSSSEIEHRPDQLPLLQHALQATWHAAMRRWSDIAAEDDRPKIERADLPGQDINHTQPPDLGSCLRVRADRAAERAAGRFARITRTSNAVGMAALQAAFRALARRDDRNAWVRRFADPEEMQAFMAADSIFVDQMKEPAQGEALRQSLNVFLLRGYLSGGNGRPYDISHEALIRNWPKFREWLQGPEEVTYALNRVLREVEPESFRAADDAERMQRIPSEVSLKVRMVGKHGLPEKWAEDQIAPALCNSALRQRWGKMGLKEVIALSALADDARRRAELTRQQEANARAREEAAQKQRERELMQARELAEARQKTNRRTRFGLIVATLLAIFALSQAYYVGKEKSRAETTSQIARLQSQLAKVNSINIQKNFLENRANTNLSSYFELQRDRQRGLTPKTINQAEREAADTKKSWDDLLSEADKLGAGLTGTISQIRAENEGIWSTSLSKEYREKIIANIVEGLNSFPYKTLENKLRVALYALAAIPEENATLNDLLRRTIEENRQRSYFRASTASQMWGLAFTQRTSGQLAAIGDDNGVVWIWDPSARPGGPPKNTLTAANGVVNGLAFNADGTLLAAAYRNGGTVVWDPNKSNKDVLCPLRPTGGNSGAYGVAFSGKFLAIASGDKAVHLWDVSQQGCPAIPGKVFHRADLVFGVAFSPSGKLLAAASGDGTVAVWDINSPDQPLLDKSVGNGKPMYAVAFSPDGQTLAATGAEGIGYLWDVEAGERFNLRTELPQEGGTVGQISFSPNSEMVVATARPDGTAIVTDVKSGGRRLVLEGTGQALFGVAFSPDSKYLLAGSNLLNTARLLAIDADQLGGVAGRDELISRGVQRIAGTQLNQGTSLETDDECGILRRMEIPIFKIAEWDDNDRALVCPFPFLGKG